MGIKRKTWGAGNINSVKDLVTNKGILERCNYFLL